MSMKSLTRACFRRLIAGKYLSPCIARVEWFFLTICRYFGKNIPGKAREALNYMGGLPLYREKIWDSANNGYAGFVLAN